MPTATATQAAHIACACLTSWVGWVESNPILSAALLGIAAYIFRGFVDNRRKAKAAVSISLCALEYVTERFEAAIEGRLKFALRGARTTEMIEGMRTLEIASLPHEIIDAFIHLRSDVYAVNVRISEVFSAHDGKDRVRRIAERREDLVSAARVFSDALSAFKKLNDRVSFSYLTKSQSIRLPPNLQAYVEASCANQTPSGDE